MLQAVILQIKHEEDFLQGNTQALLASNCNLPCPGECTDAWHVWNGNWIADPTINVICSKGNQNSMYKNVHAINIEGYDNHIVSNFMLQKLTLSKYHYGGIMEWMMLWLEVQTTLQVV